MRRRFGWILAAWGASFRSVLEYRGAAATQALLMLANNLLFLSFWVIFFRRVPDVGGWTLPDVALCYGMAASAFGLAALLCGGMFELSTAITRGGLDTWLLRPRSVLGQGLSSRLRLSGLGDVVTGPLLLVLTGQATPARIALFAGGAIVGALVFASFMVACHALAFWLGRAEELSMLGISAILSFALYPSSIFHGSAKVLLYTLLPAGLMSWLPAELVLRPDPRQAGLLLVGSAAAAGVSLLVWRAGLARYESGNLTQSVDA